MVDFKDYEFTPSSKRKNPYIEGIKYNKFDQPMLGKLDLGHFYREPLHGDILLRGENIFIDKGHSNFESNASKESIQQIQQGLGEAEINSDKYSRVADLGAGSSPFYRLVLKPLGWKANQLTNFDCKIPRKNPVPGSMWLPVDLQNFEHALYGGWEIPQKLINLKGKFDFVAMTYGIDWGPISSIEAISAFLLRNQGVVFEDFGQAGQILSRSGRWEAINTQTLPFHFWRKISD
ncbi:hypothetical protein COT75_03830 [Candidatus Beckwithbacteria bacterium CG10_big_fil_rev_8_21_14_0_10_34_10]|uniref:Methyltransferase n=1 Tax=Candidatus Beckwithbacteria bacterium CG10_big_fil_rev_8_21_14_0_10_34_10 TaxID=1974495 RepID=A0A2H0W8I9_9BACT|nr:MAG: hypothetical protein COT75_03830 [Candidatus Beckwithbacteria bacterium CG10_big_fil_rev_8_21_14_0_10_34_10]